MGKSKTTCPFFYTISLLAQYILIECQKYFTFELKERTKVRGYCALYAVNVYESL